MGIENELSNGDMMRGGPSPRRFGSEALEGYTLDSTLRHIHEADSDMLEGMFSSTVVTESSGKNSDN